MPMAAVYVITLLTNLVVPVLLLIWVLKSRTRSRLVWLSIVTLTAGYLVVLHYSIVGMWLVFGPVLPVLLTALLTAVLAIRWGRGLPTAWLGGARWTTLAVLALNTVLVTLLAWAMTYVIGADRYTATTPLDVAYPLRDGTFVVMGGGANGLVNQHALSGGPQRYALDILQLNYAGARASGLWPKEMTHYRIYGTQVVSPCDGTVLSTRDGLPDRAVGDFDPDHPGGNFVLLECAGHGVVLAHLLAGSVAVAPEERVSSGQLLGRVGNSGASMEPHLHIHAIRRAIPGDDGFSDSAEPLPLTFHGEALSKNDLFRN